MRLTCATLSTLLLLAALPSARAAEVCQDLTLQDLASLARYQFSDPGSRALAALVEGRRFQIGAMRIVRQPIFDAANPDEDRWLYRAADAVHIDTRESVIREVILFKEDDRVTVADLIESERILRRKPYLYDARVLPRRLCGDRLDVDIVTRDVWTLNPRLDFSRSGGDNSLGIGLSELNLLGAGRELSAGYTSDPDRRGVDVYYSDPNLFGSRVGLFAFVSDNNDGSQQSFEVRRPFFALDAGFALGGRVDRLDQEESLYFRNREFADFQRDFTGYAVSGGVFLGRRGDRVRRITGGYRFEEHRFAPVGGRVAPNPFPEDRTFGYPFIGFESIEDAFEVATNVDRIQRTEDLYLGQLVQVELGYSDAFFGGDGADRAVMRLNYQDAWRGKDRHRALSIFTFGASARGYWNFNTDDTEEVLLQAFASYRQQHSARFSFAGSAEATYARDLFADQQLLLGGDTGLRGYPSRYQLGDRRFLVNLEERYFSDIYLLRLLRLGYAAFLDVGRAWFPGDPDRDDFGVLANVGIGLRLESTRTRRDRIFHIDLAFPLIDGPGVDSVQLSFTVKSQL
jgi:hypothetical protein